jgi:hypothetical protein
MSSGVIHPRRNRTIARLTTACHSRLWPASSKPRRWHSEYRHLAIENQRRGWQRPDRGGQVGEPSRVILTGAADEFANGDLRDPSVVPLKGRSHSNGDCMLIVMARRSFVGHHPPAVVFLFVDPAVEMEGASQESRLH